MDMAAISPSLTLCFSPEENGLFSRPQVWRRRHFVTRSASARLLGFLPGENPDVLDTASRNILGQQQRPTSRQTASPGPPSGRLDIEEVLNWAETYRRSESQRHRIQVMEQVQRAVRHEGLTPPPEPQPSTGLLAPMASVRMEVVSMATKDACTQTEEMRCHLLLQHERSTDQHPNTDLLTRHNSCTPLLVREHIYPPVTRTSYDWHTKDPCSAPKRNDTPDTQKAFNHTPAHLQLHNAGTSVSKNRIKTNSTVYEKAAAMPLTPHVNYDNTQRQTTCTDRLTQTDVENTRNNAAVTRNQKHVSFSGRHTDNCSTSSSRLLSQGQPSTPLFFHSLQHMQWKILTGQVDRKIYMNRCKHRLASTRPVVSAGALFSHGHYIL
ncbi:hypothetical protein BsWGS_28317 [Bradybaena similaris]